MTIQEALQKYSYYHVIEVAPGIFTPGWKEIQPIQAPVTQALRSLPVKGKRVLDIGCRDGLFSFEAERMGAAEVIGIDNDLSAAAVEFLIPHFGSKVRMFQMNLFELRPADFGRFDVVICAGVLYHLRYPFHALRLIRDVMNDGAALLLETAMYTMHETEPLLWCPTGKNSPYEPTSVTFFNHLGLEQTLQSLGIWTHSTYWLNGHITPVDRATIIGSLRGESVDEYLRHYWDGSHNLNSDPEANATFLKAHQKEISGGPPLGQLTK